MEAVLTYFLPRLLPAEVSFQIIAHSGKSSLEKSLPRKLRGWREPGVHFVVVRDNDGADCLKIKANLREICVKAGRPDTLLRLACQELEAWFLGDLAAVGRAFSRDNLARLQNNSKYRDPDTLLKPSLELKALLPGYQKVNGARNIAPLLNIDKNTSVSFKVFVQGVRKLFAPASASLD